MSIPSGGAPIGPQDPSGIDTADMQQTAASSQAMRKDIGMIKDTMTQSFTQLPNAKTDVKGSEPGRPGLEHPVTTVVVAPGAEKTATQEAVQEKYQEFFEKLPVELQMAVIKNNALPPDQQDPKLLAFNMGILAEANATVWAEQVLSSDAAQGTGEGSGEGGTEGAKGAKSETPGVVLDADGKPIIGQTAINGNGEGGGDGQNGNEEFSAKFWAAQGISSGANASKIVEATLPGASTIDIAKLASTLGIPGPMLFNLNPEQQKALVIANSTQMLQGQQTTLQAQLAVTPLSDPNTVVLAEFLKIISDAIESCKGALRLMMSTQTDIQAKDSIAKTDSMKAKLQLQLDKLEKMHEAASSGSSSGKMAGMIVLAVVMAVLTIATGGILAVLLCETIVGFVIVLAVTIVLAIVEMVLMIVSATTAVNVIAEVLKLLAQILNAMGIPSPTAEIIVAVVVIVVAILLIVVLILLIPLAGPAMQIVIEVCLEAVVTVGVMVIASGNCVATVVVPLLKAFGVPEDVAEIIAMIITIIVILAMCLVAVAGAAAALSRMSGGTAKAGANAAEAAAEGTQASINAGAKAGSKVGAKASAEVVEESAEATIQAGSKAGTKASSKALQVAEESGEGAVRGSWALNKAGLHFSPQTMGRMLQGLNAIAALAEMGVQGTQAAMALGQAIILFKKAQLAMEIGDLDALIAEFEAYLKQLDASMKSIQDMLEETMKSISSLSQLFNHIVQSMSQTVSSMERIG